MNTRKPRAPRPVRVVSITERSPGAMQRAFLAIIEMHERNQFERQNDSAKGGTL
jgi:hypothetical protein